MTRHQFFTYKQSNGQSFNEFLTELRNRSENCESNTLRDSMIWDIINCGVNDNKLREHFLKEENITLYIRVIQLGQACQIFIKKYFMCIL